MQRLLNVRETAALLRVSSSKIYQLANSNQLPHLRIGARVLFPEAELERFILESTVRPDNGKPVVDGTNIIPISKEPKHG